LSNTRFRRFAARLRRRKPVPRRYAESAGASTEISILCLAHDCVIGDFVTFAPDVHCNGGVIVEDYAYIGTGAIIKQGTVEKPIVIGRGAVVGMGAAVTKSVAPFTTVVGNPAIALKK
jgi:acetyltransferase-like isoleucine patch superfamily enzyme